MPLINCNIEFSLKWIENCVFTTTVNANKASFKITDAKLEKTYGLIAADLHKQKALDADPRAIQQIIITGKIKSAVANTRVLIYYIFQQSKETMLQFSKGTENIL